MEQPPNTAGVAPDTFKGISQGAGSGPLAGVRILEIESIGPGPFAAMLLADLGANVLRVSRIDASKRRTPNPVLERGRAGIVQLDLKSSADRKRALELIGRADALIEGFRPGVMERVGLGPTECLAANPRLVYGRVTGWGRTGPMAKAAGHDINYIALSGALYACGTRESGPVPPLNLVGDFGGGGLILALGVVSALLEARTSNRGQVVDTAMAEGAGTLMSMIYGLKAIGRWNAPRAGNILDGSAYYYRCYECSCGGWMAVGAIEIEFRRQFLNALGLEAEVAALLDADDCDAAVHARIAAIFRAQPREHWQTIFGVGDHCVSPVLRLDEVSQYPQNQSSNAFRSVDGILHPAPVPNFSRTPLADPGDATHAASKLEAWD
jgi:alpha-methylacyl-CoA racemase